MRLRAFGSDSMNHTFHLPFLTGVLLLGLLSVNSHAQDTPPASQADNVTGNEPQHDIRHKQHAQPNLLLRRYLYACLLRPPIRCRVILPSLSIRDRRVWASPK